jgi:anthranilate synthase component 1
VNAQALTAYPPLSIIERIIVKEKRGNCVPVYVELPADLLTPCMAYLKIAKDSKYSFILESVVAGENIARYSFIGSGSTSSVVYWDLLIPVIL